MVMTMAVVLVVVALVEASEGVKEHPRSGSVLQLRSSCPELDLNKAVFSFETNSVFLQRRLPVIYRLTNEPKLDSERPIDG